MGVTPTGHQSIPSSPAVPAYHKTPSSPHSHGMSPNSNSSSSNSNSSQDNRRTSGGSSAFRDSFYNSPTNGNLAENSAQYHSHGVSSGGGHQYQQHPQRLSTPTSSNTSSVASRRSRAASPSTTSPSGTFHHATGSGQQATLSPEHANQEALALGILLSRREQCAELHQVEIAEMVRAGCDPVTALQIVFERTHTR